MALWRAPLDLVRFCRLVRCERLEFLVGHGWTVDSVDVVSSRVLRLVFHSRKPRSPCRMFLSNPAVLRVSLVWNKILPWSDGREGQHSNSWHFVDCKIQCKSAKRLLLRCHEDRFETTLSRSSCSWRAQAMHMQLGWRIVLQCDSGWWIFVELCRA